MKKKVLFVISTLYNGGGEKSLISLLQTMHPDKYEIDLLLFRKMGMFLEQVPEYVNIRTVPKEMEYLYDNNKKGRVDYKGIRLISTGISTLLSKSYVGQRQIRWKYFYSKFIKKEEKTYDVAIAYMEGEPIYYVVDKVKADKKIAWIHNDYTNLGCSPKFDEIYFSKVDNIVSVSDKCVEILKDTFVKYKNKISYIPNLTSSQTIKSMSEKFYPSEYNNQENILLSIGRLNHQKGFDMAIDAAKCLSNKGYNFKWMIIGDGSLEDELKKQIQKNGLESKIFLLGTKENPYPYIKNCDIFVQTSRFEGKSIALDEAKILAKPILVTNYPTAKDQLINDKEGIIVDLNSQAIAEGLANLIDNRDKRKKLSQYLSSFEYGNENLINLYYEIID